MVEPRPAIRTIVGQFGRGDSVRSHRHPDPEAGVILANPSLTSSGRGGERSKGGTRRQHGAPPADNANAWAQHISMPGTAGGARRARITHRPGVT